MALPTDGGIARIQNPAPFRAPLTRAREPLVDWSRGGVSIQDPSFGLDVLDWRARYFGGGVYLDAPGRVEPFFFFAPPGSVVEIAFSFDLSMNVVLGWSTEDGEAAFRWFDPVVAEYVTVPLPENSRSVRVKFDDVRWPEANNVGDTIIAYIRGGSLFYRMLRERFEVEHELYNHAWMPMLELGHIGMNRSVPPCFQFQLKGRIPDSSPKPEPNPVPSIESISPVYVEAGGAAFTLIVSGSDFRPSSVVRWNGEDRETVFVSATELRAAILSGDIEESGSASVSVHTPAPGGGTSNSATLTIEEPVEPVLVVFDEPGAHEWIVPAGVTSVDVLVVAGGGGGGATAYGSSNIVGRGGGGAGGVLAAQGVAVTPETAIPIIVGAGGAGGIVDNPQTTGLNRGRNGEDSSFGALSAIGGGGGGPAYSTGTNDGADGGSGGGAGFRSSVGGQGVAGQGNAGGSGSGSGDTGGGGGGYSAPGQNTSGTAGRAGGDGITLEALGFADAVPVLGISAVGGGGGSGAYSGGTNAGGDGGLGGGGKGGGSGYLPGEDGAPNTGGGGGGSGGGTGTNNVAEQKGGNGGSGIVIVRYVPPG